MKKGVLSTVLMIVLLPLFLVGCGKTVSNDSDLQPEKEETAAKTVEETQASYEYLSSNGSCTVYPVKKANNSVDIYVIDRFLSSNSDYPNYARIKYNVPDILSYLVNITPEQLRRKCTIYRFCYEPGTSLAGETFLIYGDEVYPIGNAFGGYGITEFAYQKNDDVDMLYFIYSWGSGIHLSHLGAFDFNKRTVIDNGGFGHVLGDIAFALTEGSETLGICKAEISWADWNTFDVTVTKGELVYEDVGSIRLTPVTAEE